MSLQFYEFFNRGVHGARHPAKLRWFKGHAGTPGNECAAKLRCEASGREKWSEIASLAYLKLRISERFRKAEDDWHADPNHHGAKEICPPSPKKLCMDRTRNAIGRTAAQIRTGHLRSSGHFERIKKRGDYRGWFCHEREMTRSHALLHCNEREFTCGAR